MVAVITSVLAGATAALVAALASSHSLAASIIAGAIVAIVAVAALMEYQLSVRLRYAAESEDTYDMATEQLMQRRGVQIVHTVRILDTLGLTLRRDVRRRGR
jgi:hypothetical protein